MSVEKTIAPCCYRRRQTIDLFSTLLNNYLKKFNLIARFGQQTTAYPVTGMRISNQDRKAIYFQGIRKNSRLSQSKGRIEIPATTIEFDRAAIAYEHKFCLLRGRAIA